MATYEKWYEFQNYHGHVNLTSERRYSPANLSDLIDIVREAEADGKRVRAMGSGWSFTKVNATEDYLVSTDLLKNTLSETMSGKSYSDPVFRSLLPSVAPSFPNCDRYEPYLKEGETGLPYGFARPDVPAYKANRGLLLYHVEAGIKIRDLYCRLQETPDGRGCGTKPGGFALPTLGGAAGQSLAGAISTSTHGGDKFLPPLPDMVLGIHLVTTAGEQYFLQKRSRPIVDVSRLSVTAPGLNGCANIVTSDTAFNAVLVSMGRMGIIYSMVIEVRPQFFLEERTEEFTWQEVRDNVDKWRRDKSDRYLQVTVLPYPNILPEWLTDLHPEGGPPALWPFVGVDSSTSTSGLGGHKCFVARRKEVTPTGLDWAGALLAGCPPPGEGDVFTWACKQDPELQQFLYRLVTGHPLAVQDVVGPCGYVPDFLLGSWSDDLCHFYKTITFGFTESETPQTIGESVGNALTILTQFGEAGAALAGTVVNTIIESQLRAYKRGISYSVMDIHDYEAQCLDGYSIEVAFNADEHTYLDFVEWVHKEIWSLSKQRTLVPCYISLRYCGASTALLAIEQWAQTVVIEIATLGSVPRQVEVLRSFEQHAVDLGATVHWGQLSHRSAADIEKAYGADNIGYWRGTLRRLCGHPNRVFQTFDNDFSQSHGLEYVGSARPYYDRIRDEFPSGCEPVTGVLKPGDLMKPKPPKPPIPATEVPLSSFAPNEPDKKPYRSGGLPLAPIFRSPIPVPGPDQYGIRVPTPIPPRVLTEYNPSPRPQLITGESLKPSPQFLGPMQPGALPSKYLPVLSRVPQTKPVNKASYFASPNLALGRHLFALPSTAKTKLVINAPSFASPNLALGRFKTWRSGNT